MKNKKKIILLAAFFALFITLPIRGASSILQSYIKEGLKNNLVMKQKQWNLKKSIEALKEAKALFLPSVSLEARYSKAGGGRTIEMPIGDLMNPVHLTLNQLLQANAQPPSFPANIENQTIPFLRKTDQDTKLRLTQSIYNPAISQNRKIKSQMVEVEETTIELYKQQLILDIKTAYFNHLKTLNVRTLLQETESVLQENIRFSQSLYKNGKVTEEVLLRSKAAYSQLKSQISLADRDIQLTRAYFNFLLNRPLDQEFRVDRKTTVPAETFTDPARLIRKAAGDRLELKQMDHAISIQDHMIKLHRSAILPRITAVLDYGIQGEKYSLSGDSDYWMGSLVLSWNLFNFGRDRAKMKQAVYEKKSLQTQKKALDLKIKLEIKQAIYNLNTARKTLKANDDLVKTTARAFDIIEKKYRAGTVPQIEYLQSRRDYTDAKLSRSIQLYDLYIRMAELDKETAKKRNRG